MEQNPYLEANNYSVTHPPPPPAVYIAVRLITAHNSPAVGPIWLRTGKCGCLLCRRQGTFQFQWILAIWVTVSCSRTTVFHELRYIRMGAKIPGAISPGRLNFVTPLLIFVGPQYGTCFMSHFCCLEFWGRFLENSCTPVHRHEFHFPKIRNRRPMPLASVPNSTE